MTRYRTIVADPPWEIGDFPPNFGYETGKACPYPTMTLTEIEALPVQELAAPGAELYVWTINAYVEQTYSIVRGWGFDPSCLLTWCKPQYGVGLGGKFPSNTEFILYAVSRAPRIVETRREIARLLREQLAASGRRRSEIDAHFKTRNIAGHWFTPDGHSVNTPTFEQWEWLREWLGVPDDSPLDGLIREENARKGAPISRAPGRWYQWPRGAHSTKPEAFLDLVESVSPGPYLELFARRDRLGWDTWGNESLGTAEVAA